MGAEAILQVSGGELGKELIEAVEADREEFAASGMSQVPWPDAFCRCRWVRAERSLRRAR